MPHQNQMKKIASLLLLIIYAVPGFSQDTLNQYRIKYYTEKVQRFLDKEKGLSAYYSIDREGIRTYASMNDKLSRKSEFFIGWPDLPKYKEVFDQCPSNTAFEIYKKGLFETGDLCRLANAPQNTLKGDKKMSGLKIAIDPGHIANNFETGDLEKKHIKFKKEITRNLVDSVEIAEGMLTYATAVLLKEKLEAEGAEIMLTRPNGTSAFGKTYAQWKKEDLKKAVDSLYKIGELKAPQKNYFLSAKAQDRDIFRVIFRDLELAKRAELINNYKPDITVIIHFNVDETNAEWINPTKKDFNMTFVGGAFMKSDLSNPEKRFEFLRLLITNDLENSISLSTSMINSFEKILEVPTAGEQDAKYIAQSCLSTGKKGVYCRNLQLTRYVHSPLVYGETLYQDNIKESQLLNKESDKTKNERIKQVAEAYYSGILSYISTVKK